MINFVETAKQYQNGNEVQKQEALTKITAAMRSYVKNIIKSDYSIYCNDYYEDLYQTGMIGVVMGVGSYDASQKNPEEYFKPYIVNEIDRFIRILK